MGIAIACLVNRPITFMTIFYLQVYEIQMTNHNKI